MAISYRCDTSLGCTFVVWHHDVTRDEWHTHVARLWSDPAFPPGRAFLVDLRAAGDVPGIASDFVEDMGIRINAEEKMEHLRLAVIPSGAWDKAARLVYEEMRVPGLQAVVFNEVGRAATWLGLSADVVREVLHEMLDELANSEY